MQDATNGKFIDEDDSDVELERVDDNILEEKKESEKQDEDGEGQNLSMQTTGLF